MIGALVATAPTAGQFLLRRLGTRGVLILGIGIEAAAFAFLSRIDVDSAYAAAVVPGLLILGVGIGLVMPVAFNSGTRGIPDLTSAWPRRCSRSPSRSAPRWASPSWRPTRAGA